MQLKNKIDKLNKKDKVMLQKFKKAVAEIIKTIGYTKIAKSIPKMASNEIEKNVMWIIDNELATGKGCQFLTNPITRIKTKNPMRPKYQKAKIMIQKAIKRIKELENNL